MSAESFVVCHQCKAIVSTTTVSRCLVAAEIGDAVEPLPLVPATVCSNRKECEDRAAHNDAIAAAP